MSIGLNLHKLRKIKQITLKQLAESSGVSAALLSQIERGKANPSVNTLKRLADSLGISVGYFFDEADDDTFVTRQSARNVLKVGSGITYYLLSRKTAPNLEVLYNVFEVGATTGNEPYSHVGEECGIVLEGTLQVQLADRVFILEEGDSISYSSSIPHKLTNIGTTQAKAIWINTPPTF
ncbi:MAG TPA: helix-turn-helix domain-containing protein [Firmicutes bacterium]|nr:helix-turn-helix domain-containing protein [Bacillota bacterium]